jgi:hypothetical protein
MPVKVKSRSLRLSRRSVLRSVGAAAGLALTSLVPKGIFADSSEPEHDVTPHWDMVLKHVRDSSPHEKRNVESLLLKWTADLVLSPSERREALIVHGPTESGKTALHNAMSTLLDTGNNQYLHGQDERQLLDWGLQPGRRLAAYERSTAPMPDRKRRDAVLERQVHTFQYKELLWWESTWQPGTESHRNALFWYEAVLDNRPLTSELPTRTTKWSGARCKTLESHLYLGKVENPIPRLDLVRYLQDERDAFTKRLARLHERLT